MNRRLVPALALVAFVLGSCGSSTSSPAPTSPSAASGSPALLVTPSGPGASPRATAGGTNEPGTPGAPSSATPAPTVAAFTLTTAAFHTDGVIPARFTCDGRDISPAMAWTGTPVGTKWLVLVMVDIDAHEFTHWIAYAISPGTTRLAEGAGAASSQLAQGTNDFGHVGYGGPCPPSGTHRYVWRLYALAAPIGLSGTPDGATVRAALAQAQVLGKATIMAWYARSG